MESIKVRSPCFYVLPPTPKLTPPLQNAANYVSETVQGTGAEASKEANKSVAKDSDASLSSRASAAKDAVSDKIDESSHDTKADVHKGESTIQAGVSRFAVTDTFYRGLQALDASFLREQRFEYARHDDYGRWSPASEWVAAI